MVKVVKLSRNGIKTKSVCNGCKIAFDGASLWGLDSFFAGTIAIFGIDNWSWRKPLIVKIIFWN